MSLIMDRELITPGYSVGLDAAGTITGATSQAQAFTNGLIAPSLKPAADSITALQLQTSAGAVVLNLDTTNNRIGVGAGATAPAAKVHIVAANDLTQLMIDGNATQTAPLVRLRNSAGSPLLDLHSGGNSTVFLGYLAGATYVTGGQGRNTFVGEEAGRYNQTGRDNVFIGWQTARGQSGIDTSGIQNVIIGVAAAWDLTTGSYNVIIGGYAGYELSTGTLNMAMGLSALRNNVNGTSNTAIGTNSLFTGTSISRNVAIGGDVLYTTTSSNNTGVGYRAGYLQSTGANNIYVGYQAGDNVTTGSNNIIIGYDLDAPSATASSQLYIGGILYGDIATGRIGIGTTAPDTLLHALLTDAGTDAVVNVLTVGHESSGTPAAGFGVGVHLTLESSTTAKQSAALLAASWIVATHASRTARLALSAYDYGGAREGIRIDADGSQALLSFYGVAATARQLLATGAGATVDQVITALQTLGLLKQS